MFLQGRVLLSNSSKKTLTSLTFIDENFREVKFLNRRKQIEKNYAPGEYVKLVKEFRQAGDIYNQQKELTVEYLFTSCYVECGNGSEPTSKQMQVYQYFAEQKELMLYGNETPLIYLSEDKRIDFEELSKGTEIHEVTDTILFKFQGNLKSHKIFVGVVEGKIRFSELITFKQKTYNATIETTCLNDNELNEHEKELIKKIATEDIEDIDTSSINERISKLQIIAYYCERIDLMKQMKINEWNFYVLHMLKSEGDKHYRNTFLKYKNIIEKKFITDHLEHEVMKFIGWKAFLENFTEDNLYFLKNYISQDKKKKNWTEDWFKDVVLKIFKLKNYNRKELLCKAIPRTRIIKKFFKTNDYKILQNDIAKDESSRRTRIATRQFSSYIEDGLLNKPLFKVMKKTLKTALIKRDIPQAESLYSNLVSKELAINSGYGRFTTQNTGHLEKLKGDFSLPNEFHEFKSEWVSVAKTLDQISTSGMKAKCCLKFGGLLERLLNYSYKNHYIGVFYGTLNGRMQSSMDSIPTDQFVNKNFQTLVWKKIDKTGNITLILDNIECSSLLTFEDTKLILEEIERNFPNYGIEIGKLRTDAHIKEAIELSAKEGAGLMCGTDYFHDSEMTYKMKLPTEHKIGTLEVRDFIPLDLLGISQLEESHYEDYDEYKQFVTKALSGEAKIKVISDKFGNIYGYSILKKGKCFSKTESGIHDIIRSDEYNHITEFMAKYDDDYNEFWYLDDIFIVERVRCSKTALKFFSELTKDYAEYEKIYAHLNDLSASLLKMIPGKIIDLSNYDEKTGGKANESRNKAKDIQIANAG